MIDEAAKMVKEAARVAEEAAKRLRKARVRRRLSTKVEGEVNEALEDLQKRPSLHRPRESLRGLVARGTELKNEKTLLGHCSRAVAQ